MSGPHLRNDGFVGPSIPSLAYKPPSGPDWVHEIKPKGDLVFQQACAMGLEGIVSKRLTAPYRSGPSRDWLKIKNPESPAMRRARAGLW
jgi:hypothetical protein